MKIQNQNRFFIDQNWDDSGLERAITEKQVKTRIKNKIRIYSFIP